MTENGFVPAPQEIFADIPYLEENFKLRRIRYVCTLYAGALVSDSLLHMLSYRIKKKMSYRKNAFNCLII